MTENIEAADQDRSFTGLSRLYGNDAAARLRDGFVAVIGVGGVGSWACEALARSGVGRLLLIDPDSIAQSNINRQLPALLSTVGAAKVDTIKARIADIQSICQVDTIEDALTAHNISHLIPNTVDVVIDAIDAPRIKAALIAHCKMQQIAVIVCGAAGGRDDPLALHASDLALTKGDALLSKTRARLRSEHGFTRIANKKFKVTAICSAQTPLASRNAQDISDNAAASGAPLNCAGYGSIVTVTAAMGMAAASKAIGHIINAKLPTQTLEKTEK